MTTACENASNREIVNTRVLSATREQVFAAIADPVRLARWWGPAGFSNTFQQFDFLPGGTWRFVMHAPDGADYANTWVFERIERPERIVMRHLLPMHEFLLTMLLAIEAGKARLTWHMVFETVEECDRVRAFVGPANEQNFDRLEAELAKVT